MGKFHVRESGGRFATHQPLDPSTRQVKVTGHPTGADIERLTKKTVDRKDAKK